MVKRMELRGLPLTEHSMNYFFLKKFFIIDTDDLGNNNKP